MKALCKLFIILMQSILINIGNNKKSNLEKKIIRYIKFHRKNITIELKEEKLLSIINYIQSIKDKKNNETFYFEISKPNVSFISPVFNQLSYLSSFISSVQNQKLIYYELIFIDDFSTDKSDEYIVEKIKTDKRIKLIRNKKNMGTLYSRYIGQKMAQANYGIFLDCDDIVLKDGISKSYKHIIKYNLDIVQFLTVWETKDSINIKTNLYKYNKIISKPILTYIFYYDYYKGKELNFALWDKLVKREIINKAFEYIGDTYIKKNIVVHNDLIILFSLFQKANNYQYIDVIGYYYNRNNKNSAMNSRTDPTKKEKIINSLFLNVQFLYEKTNDTHLDKYFCIYKIQDYFKTYKQLFMNLNNQNNYYYFFKSIFDKILNLEYLSKEEILHLNIIKELGVYK